MYKVGDEVKVEFMGKIKRIELTNDGYVVYNVQSDLISCFNLSADYICPLEEEKEIT